MKREKFFLFVGANHEIKNIQFIVDMFEKFRGNEYFKNYKLYLVSHCKEFQSKNVQVIPIVSRPELLTLYRTATAYLSASHYESFNFPVLEALSQKCPVVSLESAVIPEMKEYVYSAPNGKVFLEFMRRVAKGSLKKYSITDLHKQFSWEDYISRLRSLYN
jgi:glycosyltransferase involved in cell wall biosynthesis